MRGLWVTFWIAAICAATAICLYLTNFTLWFGFFQKLGWLSAYTFMCLYARMRGQSKRLAIAGFVCIGSAAATYCFAFATYGSQNLSEHWRDIASVGGVMSTCAAAIALWCALDLVPLRVTWHRVARQIGQRALFLSVVLSIIAMPMIPLIEQERMQVALVAVHVWLILVIVRLRRRFPNPEAFGKLVCDLGIFYCLLALLATLILGDQIKNPRSLTMIPLTLLYAIPIGIGLLSLLERAKGSMQTDRIFAGASLTCPRCGLSQHISAGESRCHSCGLHTSLGFRYPQCACGIRLIPGQHVECPECGRPVRYIQTFREDV